MDKRKNKINRRISKNSNGIINNGGENIMEDIINNKIAEYREFCQTINAPCREYLYNKKEIKNIIGRIKTVLEKTMITDFTINLIDFIEREENSFRYKSI